MNTVCLNTGYRQQLRAELQQAWQTYESRHLRCHANIVYKVMLRHVKDLGDDLTPQLAADLASEMALWVFTDLHEHQTKYQGF